MAPERRYDRTLVDWEIEAAYEQDHEFIQHYERRGLKGASYDVHAGDQMYIATAESPGITIVLPEPLQNEANAGSIGFRIESGRSVVIRSHESVRMPDDMVGRLSLRATWALAGLSFAGGIVDPGYWGHLFLAIVNDSDAAIEIPVALQDNAASHMGDALVALQFTRLSKAAHHPLPDEKQIMLPANRRPRPPKVNPYSAADLTTKINKQQENIDKFEGNVKQLDDTLHELTERLKAVEEGVADFRAVKPRTDAALLIVEGGFLAILAGITASAGIGAVQSGLKAGFGGVVIAGFIAVLVLLVVGITLLISLLISRLRKRSGRSAPAGS